MENPALLLSSALTMLLLFPVSAGTAVSVAHNNFTDLSALLEFKANIGDPIGVLASNWTTNTSFCTWIGVVCNYRRQRVTALHLDGFSLHGAVSPHLGNLSFLHSLRLGNNTLVGPIPDSVGRLPRLRFLNLQINQLSGAIPPALFNMSSLITLSLATNNLSGPLPQNHTLMLPRLQWISLGDNQLTGTIPPSFALCHELRLLSLSINHFSGTIPAELASLSELSKLLLGGNNLTGMIPATIANLTKLEYLDLDENSLQGGLPAELGSLRNLELLNFAVNRLTGPVPVSLSNASMLRSLDLSSNNLTGSVPTQLGRNWPLLEYLNLGDNRLQGGLDFITSLSNCRALSTVEFPSNDLSGVLPDSVGNLSSTPLLRFRADNNRIRGHIPAEIANLSSLIALILYNNELAGSVPSSLARLRALQALYLDYNRLDGPIPHELGQLTSLSYLILDYNALVGSIPDSIGNITGLRYLILAGNELSSAIPRSIWTLTGLSHLRLSFNYLNGSLHPDVGNLKSMDVLSLSSNHLSGIIPSSLGGMDMLSTLNLSHNSFHGLIPQSFGRLINIKSIDLSYNDLSGAIPESLADLRYLSDLNLSYNILEGRVPEHGAFTNLTIQSLIGNEALCGVSRLGFLSCSTNDTSYASRTPLHLIKILVPVFASGLALVSCICLILWIRRRRQRAKTPDPTDTSHIDGHRVISYHELTRATNNFSEANILGRGRFSSVYRGLLDEGLFIAVKVFNLEIEGASPSFDAECQALRVLRHRNLVKIITTCSNLDFKALVLHFMPGGNLERWLYSGNYYLNLLQRINIVMDVALALEYLHDHHVVHCDLKPSNVLLDQNMTAHVTDFGIAKLLISGSKSVVLTSEPGTIGYIAPEYGSTGGVSRRSDIYSYGILLLETFTRKKPTDGMFDGEMTLRRWVCEAHPATMIEVVDNNLIRDEDSDERPNGDLSARLKCLSTIIELGLQCSKKSPKERIQMKDVVKRLEKIKKEFLYVQVI